MGRSTWERHTGNSEAVLQLGGPRRCLKRGRHKKRIARWTRGAKAVFDPFMRHRIPPNEGGKIWDPGVQRGDEIHRKDVSRVGSSKKK